MGAAPRRALAALALALGLARGADWARAGFRCPARLETDEGAAAPAARARALARHAAALAAQPATFAAGVGWADAARAGVPLVYESAAWPKPARCARSRHAAYAAALIRAARAYVAPGFCDASDEARHMKAWPARAAREAALPPTLTWWAHCDNTLSSARRGLHVAPVFKAGTTTLSTHLRCALPGVAYAARGAARPRGAVLWLGAREPIARFVSAVQEVVHRQLLQYDGEAALRPISKQHRAHSAWFARAEALRRNGSARGGGEVGAARWLLDGFVSDVECGRTLVRKYLRRDWPAERNLHVEFHLGSAAAFATSHLYRAQLAAAGGGGEAAAVPPPPPPDEPVVGLLRVERLGPQLRALRARYALPADRAAGGACDAVLSEGGALRAASAKRLPPWLQTRTLRAALGLGAGGGGGDDALLVRLCYALYQDFVCQGYDLPEACVSHAPDVGGGEGSNGSSSRSGDEGVAPAPPLVAYPRGR